MSRCRFQGCEAELTWAEGPAGRVIPLVRITLERWRALPRRETLYGIERVAYRGATLARAGPVPAPSPEGEYYLNHFVDCPGREAFRRRR